MRLDRTWQWEASSESSEALPFPPRRPHHRQGIEGCAEVREQQWRMVPTSCFQHDLPLDSSLLILFWLSEWLFNRWRFHARDKQSKKNIHKGKSSGKENTEKEDSHTRDSLVWQDSEEFPLWHWLYKTTSFCIVLISGIIDDRSRPPFIFWECCLFHCSWFYT